MAKKKGSVLIVEGMQITLITEDGQDYLSLTDIAKRVNKRTDIVITNWLRNRNTVEFLGVWEQLHNTNFNPIGFDGIRNQTGLNSFILTTKQWVEATNAIGLQARAGRYGGTYAHKDIAFEFCSYVSPVFKLYILKEFQRLKTEETQHEKERLEWNIKRTLSKVNYRIHTDAIKKNLIPQRLQNLPKKGGIVYANEADLLNLALFGMTAKHWRAANPDKKGNIRDHATGEQLLVLANLESHNAQFIKERLSEDERVEKLNEIAIYQMDILLTQPIIKNIKKSSQ
ncbi:MAG: hypothetical protein ACI87N_002069 [Flavobacteriales bacterium]|jgi:hypothetical protein